MQAKEACWRRVQLPGLSLTGCLLRLAACRVPLVVPLLVSAYAAFPVLSPGARDRTRQCRRQDLSAGAVWPVSWAPWPAVICHHPSRCHQDRSPKLAWTWSFVPLRRLHSGPTVNSHWSGWAGKAKDGMGKSLVLALYSYFFGVYQYAMQIIRAVILTFYDRPA